MKTLFAVFALAVALLPAVAGASSSPVAGSFSHDSYAAVLEQYVNDEGRVDYAGLQQDRKALDAYASAISSLDRKTYEGWSKDEQLAFWMNAYNALTLQLIIDRYPIESSFFRSIVFPKNSIRQIAGAWDEIEFPVMGGAMTLDHIEHEIIRKQFEEPRIHVALVCAAISCPPLRKEPYHAERLDEQLDDQSRRFVNTPASFRIDRDKGILYLSSIFKWYGGDFVGKYGPAGDGPDLTGNYGDEKGAVIQFAMDYLGPEDQNYLAGASYDVKYLDYDWTLNDKTGE
jgi:hypothetical protein